MPVESAITRQVIFQVWTSDCKSAGCEGYTVYGVKADYSIENAILVEDISTNKDDVVNLIKKLENANVSADQLIYIIEDYIQELHM